MRMRSITVPSVIYFWSEQMKRLGVAPFVYKRLLTQGKAYSLEKLKENVALCVDADYAIKSGRMREEAALDRVMLLLCAS